LANLNSILVSRLSRIASKCVILLIAAYLAKRGIVDNELTGEFGSLAAELVVAGLAIIWGVAAHKEPDEKDDDDET
jgi:hypothetical protein